MDLKLKPFDFAQAAARAGMAVDGTPLKRTSGTAGLGGAGGVQAPTSVEKPSFQSAMVKAVKSVSDSQLESSRLQRELQLDNPTVSLEDTMIAMQKSQIGFQAALSVRNRFVQAYTDIMNMQV